MITTKENCKKRTFKGVDFELLSSGKKSMITKMNYKNGDSIPFHKHPNEQAGYIISGKIRIQFKNNDQILTSGDSYVIDENIEHSVEVIESGEVIDVFTPPREDYK
ncbi:MAG: cupin domain-containing protein [Bacteroidetes bacterium]|nr:cupin domain-containing protein [Bacteroidota bacterium]MBT6687400.1 cupin domain-containing protein [Bacteroidota bacterium]MBT7142596.1 cupin domain-containing protein [Bacteroidota bacterium]MBT7490135.1 cupin domain-containing protein [Bacteroidota bacterium]